MNLLLVFPIIIPFITAIVCLFLWNQVPLQRLLTVIGTFLLMMSGIFLLRSVNVDGIQATQIGDWDAPVGITLVADLFSAIMVTITGIMGFAVAVYSLGSIDNPRERHGYYPLYNVLLMGVCGAFLTGDMFNLYVWFEVLLISSFVLLALGGEGKQLSGAIQYMTLNLLSSALFLAAVGMLYSVVGTLNMADLARQVPSIKQPGIVTAIAMMLLIAFGIKAAIFPFFFWLPASYHTPPISVTAIFAALLTKVGIYALVRVFTLIFIEDMTLTHTVILVLSGFTMVSGVLGAAAEFEFRRVLSFHIISQIGYMLMGLGIFSSTAIAGVIFFLIHNILAKTNLFLISGIAYRLGGTYDLKKSGGLYKAYPVLSILFLIPALALAGVPPLSGFWAKLILVRGGLEAREYLIIGVSLFVSLWTLYSMMKLWAETFLKDPQNLPENALSESDDLSITVQERVNLWQPSMLYLLIPVIGLAALTVLMGVAANPVYSIMQDAANQLMNPSEYIRTVLG